RLAGAVAPDHADTRSRRDLHGTLVNQKTSGEADGEVGDRKHAALSPQAGPNATRFSVLFSQCESRSRFLSSSRSCSRCVGSRGSGRRLCWSRSPTASQIERLVRRSICSLSLAKGPAIAGVRGL